MTRLLLTMICIFSFAFSAEEATYIFKAKGEFAKELKALMEKHAQEGKIEIQTVDNDRSFGDKSGGIIESFLNNEEQEGDIVYGKKLYENTCTQCHGEKADKSSYNNARVLGTLSKKELVNQLENYSMDSQYGGSTRNVMYQSVVGMSAEQIVSVAAYIYSLNHDVSKSVSNLTNEAVSTTTSQGSYLK